ncbi:MAG: rhodanese-like domain-containing protein [Gemmatimonadales bacterium]
MSDSDQFNDETSGRWRPRHGGGRRWLGLILVLVVLPIVLGAIVALLAGRSLAYSELQRRIVKRFPSVRWVTTADLAGWLDQTGRPRPVVLDARTADEYAVSHIQDALRIDPYRPLLRPLRGFSQDTPIVAYSSVGYRSAGVAQWLSRQGYTNVASLQGSIFQWANEDRPLFRAGGQVSEVHPYDHRWGWLLERKYWITAPDQEKRSAAP